MEPDPALASTSGVPIRPHSRRGTAAAALVLLLQLLLLGLLPIADARASAADVGSRLGVHIEKPGVHHAVHDSEDCAFCTTMQLGAVPAPLARGPEMVLSRRELPVPERPLVTTPTLATPRLARAPPVLA